MTGSAAGLLDRWHRGRAERLGLLPAFGGFTGGARVRPRRGDRVYVLAGDEVVPVATE